MKYIYKILSPEKPRRPASNSCIAIWNLNILVTQRRGHIPFLYKTCILLARRGCGPAKPQAQKLIRSRVSSVSSAKWDCRDSWCVITMGSRWNSHRDTLALSLSLRAHAFFLEIPNFSDLSSQISKFYTSWMAEKKKISSRAVKTLSLVKVYCMTFLYMSSYAAVSLEHSFLLTESTIIYI